MKNTFEILCEKLENCPKKCNNNPIVCVKSELEYLKGDKNELLRLKAECNAAEYWGYFSYNICLATLVVSIYSMLITALQTSCILPNTIMDIFTWGCIVVCGLFTIHLLLKICKRKVEIKWRDYILTVINEYL